MEDQNKLVAALKKFNRKERYWLIQEAIGPQPLTPCFRDKLRDALKISEIPADAY